MRTYIVTYKAEDGRLLDLRVEARNHVSAGDALASEGLQVVDVQRAEPEDDGRDDDGHRPNRRAATAWKALAVGLLVAGAAVAALWWRRGCPSFF